MKTQMRFQKVLMLLTLIIAALAVVYSLIFCSGVFSQIVICFDGSEVKGIANFVEVVQSVNNKLFTLSIVFIVISLLPLIAGCQNRRKYYITNHVAVGIVVVFQIIFAILLLVYINNALQAFNGIDLESAKFEYELYRNADQFGEFQDSPWIISVGYALFVLVILNAVALVLNTLWKLMLMKGEKDLLNKTVVKEVA
jgi:hypothetical protein